MSAAFVLAQFSNRWGFQSRRSTTWVSYRCWSTRTALGVISPLQVQGGLTGSFSHGQRRFASAWLKPTYGSSKVMRKILVWTKRGSVGFDGLLLSLDVAIECL